MTDGRQPVRPRVDRLGRALAAAGVVLVVAAAVTGGYAARRGAADQPAAGDAARSTSRAAAPATGPAPATRSRPPAGGPAPLPAAVRPTTVTIPAIRVRSALVPLGLDRRGELEPPADYQRAGWYVDGPTPGEPGPAVIAGHVDSRAGPAVFYRLRDLRAGDRVTVGRSDGRAARFRVTEVHRYPKNGFPTQRVYGPTPDRALRLITCGGEFDASRSSYRDNVVVYAVAV